MNPIEKHCINCFYWELQGQSKIGICRCNPPNSNPEDIDKDYQPITAFNDWCGDFKAFVLGRSEELSEATRRNEWRIFSVSCDGTKSDLEKAMLNQIWVEDMLYEI